MSRVLALICIALVAAHAAHPESLIRKKKGGGKSKNYAAAVTLDTTTSNTNLGAIADALTSAGLDFKDVEAGSTSIAIITFANDVDRLAFLAWLTGTDGSVSSFHITTVETEGVSTGSKASQLGVCAAVDETSFCATVGCGWQATGCDDQTFYCSEGVVCDGSDYTCVDTYTCQSGSCAISVATSTGTSCDTDSGDCQDYSCDGSGSCVGTALNGGDCDGTGSPNQCQRHTCAAGSCVIAPKANTESCDDGNECTSPDLCNGAGSCASTNLDNSNSCSNPTTTPGTCEWARCNGAGACTAQTVPDTTSCDSQSDDCEDYRCMSGVCVSSSFTGVRACVDLSGNEIADDDNECTTPGCVAGICQQTNVMDGTSCGDSHVCGTTTCQTGTCMTATTASGGSACTSGEDCRSTGVCDGSSIDDCYTTFYCDSDDCCDDGNPCTTDSCDTGSGVCTNTALPTGAACEDGDPCTDGETCNASNQCVNGKTCSKCDPILGCQGGSKKKGRMF